MNKTTQVALDSRRLSTLVPGPSLPQPGKDTKSNNKHRGSGRLKKAEKALVPISNSFETLDVDRIEIDPNCRHIQMINSVIQWNCHGLSSVLNVFMLLYMFITWLQSFKKPSQLALLKFHFRLCLLSIE